MVKEQIVIIFNENKKRYGYRRITKELHNNDICVNHKTVRKLMKQLGLVCQVRAKRKYSSYKGEVGEVAPNLLERHFKTNQPNRKWVTDVTECLDNAVAENFFGLLKTELFYLEKFDSIDQLEKAIVDYIDYYNNRRIKLKLNGLSPVQYRIQTVGAA